MPISLYPYNTGNVPFYLINHPSSFTQQGVTMLVSPANQAHGYGVTGAYDDTGGDFVPSISGFEFVYFIDIVIKDAGQGTYTINNAPYIADDLIIEGVSATNFPAPGSPTSLHGISTVSGNTAYQFYEMPGPSGFPEIGAIGITEIYETDNGDYWNVFEPGAQPPITINTDPAAIRLYVSMSTSFLNIIPTTSKELRIDIDFASVAAIYGCTDPASFNYNANANTDDGSCYAIITGCMDSTADNYITPVGDVLIDINTSDSTQCQFWGCIDPTAQAQTGDGSYDCSGTLNGTDYSCCSYGGPDCLDSTALNYVTGSNYDCNQDYNGTDFSCCVYPSANCLDATALNYNYNVASNTVNGVVYDVDCNGDINGTDDSCCNYITAGCTDPNADNYDATYDYDCNSDDITDVNYTQASGWDSCCTYTITGCMDNTNSAFLGSSFYVHPGTGNVITIAWINDDVLGGCAPVGNVNGPTTLNGILACWGDSSNFGFYYENFDPSANTAGTCVLGGCMDSGNLVSPTNGGTDPYDSPNPGVAAFNYDANATYDDGSCVYFGCMDSDSTLFQSYHNADSVLTNDADLILMLTEPHTFNVPVYDPVGGVFGDCAGGYSLGCTDSNSSNYDPTATIDDGSCCVDGCMDDGGPTATDPNGNPGIFPTPLYPGLAADTFDSSYTCHDQSDCTYTLSQGCTDSNAENYDSTAQQDDGSCEYLACSDITSLQYDGVTLAGTNPGLNCGGTDYSSETIIGEPDCSNLITYSPITTHNYTCEYGCPTHSDIYIVNQQKIRIDFDTRQMPWIAAQPSVPINAPTKRNFKIKFEYGARSYKFIVQEDSTSTGEWTLELDYTQAGGWQFVDTITGATAPGLTCINTGLTGFTEAFGDAPIIGTLTGNPEGLTVNTSLEVKPFIANSTGGGPGMLYQYYHDGPYGLVAGDFQGACALGERVGSYELGCTDSNSGNYNSSATIDAGNCIAPCECCDDGTGTIVSHYGIAISTDDTDPCDPLLVVTYFNNDPNCGNNCPLPRSLHMSVTGFIDPLTGLVDPALQVTSKVNTTWFSSGGTPLIYSGSQKGLGMLTFYKGSSINSNTQAIDSFPFTVAYKLLSQGPNTGSFALNSPSFAGNVLINNVEDYYSIDDKTYQPYIDVYNTCFTPAGPFGQPPASGYQWVNNPNQGSMVFHTLSPTPLPTLLDVTGLGLEPTYGCNNVNALNYDGGAECSDGSCVGCARFVSDMNYHSCWGGTNCSHNQRVQITSQLQGLPPNQTYGIVARILIYTHRQAGFTGPISPNIMPEKVDITYSYTNQSNTTCPNNSNNIVVNWVPDGTIGTYPYEQDYMDFIMYSQANCPNPNFGTVDVSIFTLIENNIVTGLPLPQSCIALPPIGSGTDTAVVNLGCSNINAVNYDPAVNIDDGSCIPHVFGCMDPGSTINYFQGANMHDCSCIYMGCTIPDIGPPYHPDIYGYCADCNFDQCNGLLTIAQPFYNYYSGTYIQPPGTVPPGSPLANQLSSTFSVANPANGYTNLNSGCTFVGVGNTCPSGQGYQYRNYDPAATIYDTCIS